MFNGLKSDLVSHPEGLEKYICIKEKNDISELQLLAQKKILVKQV